MNNMTNVELIIKIPNEVYENIKSATADDNDISSLLLGIHEATPLPKGHGRLIDADALDIDNLNRAYDNNFELDFGRLYTADVIDMIANAPTIIGADPGD